MTSTGWSCIYCQRAFAKPAGKPEHIISKSLGGRSASRDLVCDECNNALSPAENVLVNLPPILFARAILNIGRNKGLEATFVTESGEKITIGKDKQMRYKNAVLEKPEVSIDPGTGRKKYHYKLSGEEHVDKIREQIRKQAREEYGVDEVKIDLKTDVKFVTQTLTAQADFFTEGEYRAVSKLAFAALAHVLKDKLDLQHPQFDAIRKYIRYGDKPKGEELSWFGFPKAIQLKALDTKFYNRVTINCDPKEKLITGYVEILGSFAYSVVLSESYSGEAMAFQLLNLPLAQDQQDQVAHLDRVFSVSLEELTSIDSEDPRPKLAKSWKELGDALHEEGHIDEQRAFLEFLRKLAALAPRVAVKAYPGKKYFEIQDYFDIARFIADRIEPFLRIEKERFILWFAYSILEDLDQI